MMSKRQSESSHDPLDQFLPVYEEYVNQRIIPVKEVLDAQLGRWAREERTTSNGQPAATASKSPVAFTESRIKNPGSVADKINRSSNAFNGGLCAESLAEMADLLGGRVVVHFPSDLLLMHEMLEATPHLAILEPPTAYYPEERLLALGLDLDFKVLKKNSGYRSIHYHLILADNDHHDVMFELQVRTLTDHVWAAIEHLLAYKPSSNIPPSIRKQFELLAAHLGVVDEHFELLNSEVEHLQRTSRLRARDELVMTNLPNVLRELGVGCAQRDIETMLKMLKSNGITTVRDMKAAASRLPYHRIKEVHFRELMRQPKNQSVVAIWSMDAVNPGEKSIEQLVRQADGYAAAYKGIN